MLEFACIGHVWHATVDRRKQMQHDREEKSLRGNYKVSQPVRLCCSDNDNNSGTRSFIVTLDGRKH